MKKASILLSSLWLVQSAAFGQGSPVQFHNYGTGQSGSGGFGILMNSSSSGKASDHTTPTEPPVSSKKESKTSSKMENKSSPASANANNTLPSPNANSVEEKANGAGAASNEPTPAPSASTQSGQSSSSTSERSTIDHSSATPGSVDSAGTKALFGAKSIGGLTSKSATQGNSKDISAAATSTVGTLSPGTGPITITGTGLIDLKRDNPDLQGSTDDLGKHVTSNGHEYVVREVVFDGPYVGSYILDSPNAHPVIASRSLQKSTSARTTTPGSRSLTLAHKGASSGKSPGPAGSTNVASNTGFSGDPKYIASVGNTAATAPLASTTGKSTNSDTAPSASSSSTNDWSKSAFPTPPDTSTNALDSPHTTNKKQSGGGLAAFFKSLKEPSQAHVTDPNSSSSTQGGGSSSDPSKSNDSSMRSPGATVVGSAVAKQGLKMLLSTFGGGIGRAAAGSLDAQDAASGAYGASRFNPAAIPAELMQAHKSAPSRPYQNTPIGDKWAIIVGVSRFKDSTIPVLKYPAKDARDFYDFLVNKGHFAPDHVRLLLNEQATRERIVTEIGDFLPTVVKPDDLVVFYFSSHGSPASQDPGHQNFLIAYDTKKEHLLASGIDVNYILNMLDDQSEKSRVKANRVFLCFDACHSGGTVGARDIEQGANFNASEFKLGSGRAFLCSSSADERSWDSRRYQNGVFTHYLIEALSSGGNMTKLGDAYNYLQKYVEDEVRQDEKGATQTPKLVTDQWHGNDLVLAAPPAHPEPLPPAVKARLEPDSRGR